METNDGMKIVHFDEYCKKCQYQKTKEKDEPCYSCLHEPVRQHSHKPVKYMPKQ